MDKKIVLMRGTYDQALANPPRYPGEIGVCTDRPLLMIGYGQKWSFVVIPEECKAALREHYGAPISW